MTNTILNLGKIDFSKPSSIYYIEADDEKISKNLKAMLGDEADNIDFEKLLKLNKINLSIIPNMINASYGAQNLAALTILLNSRGYVMPDSFENNFALYFDYQNEYSAFVTFSLYGEGVISANMAFVRNDKRDNIIKRMMEIESGLGEESIIFTMAKEVE